MNHRFLARTAIAIAAATIASLGVCAASAQVAGISNPHTGPGTYRIVKSSASPRFLCDSPDLCISQDAHFGGFLEEFPTAEFNEEWVSITNPLNSGPTGMMLPWGSFNDNSGSSVVFGDDQTGNTKCFKPHSRISEPANVVHYRYFWIEFGNTNCDGFVGPLP